MHGTIIPVTLVACSRPALRTGRHVERTPLTFSIEHFRETHAHAADRAVAVRVGSRQPDGLADQRCAVMCQRAVGLLLDGRVIGPERSGDLFRLSGRDRMRSQ